MSSFKLPHPQSLLILCNARRSQKSCLIILTKLTEISFGDLLKPKKKTHWVGWHKVTKSKADGGLGIQAAKGKNIALLAKLNWRLHMEKDAIWSKVLRSKYCSKRRLGARNKDRLPCSRTWKAMKMGMEVFKKGIRWIPGRNSELSLWHDNWTSNGPLRSLIQGPIAAEEEHLKVRDVLRTDGWDWSDISLQIPKEVLMEIRSIPYSMTAPNEDDKLVWNGKNKGDFDLKSAYTLAIGSMDGDDKFTGRWIWKSETLPRIKTFLWQCMHYSIGIGECLVRRCLSESDVCPMCNREPKTIIHRLRDCSFLRDTWFKLGINPSSSFYEGNLQYWLEMNCKDGSHKVRHQPPWKIVFPFAIWCIWKDRNNFVFRDRSAIVFRALEFEHCIRNAKRLDSKTVVRLRWEKPQVGWVRLNTNGSAIGNPGRARGGGILRDDQGR